MTEERRDRIGYLDGFRGVAILLVLVGHFHPVAAINLARLGVDLFFALSGRLMAELLFERRVALPVFFYRRFARVYPALVGLVLVLALVLHAGALRVGLRASLAALTFLSNYAAVFGLRSAPLDHLWSLCVEEHAYVALGLVAVAARRGVDPRAVVAALAALAFANGVVRSDWLSGDYYRVFWRSDVAAAPIFAAALAYLLRGPMLAFIGPRAPALLAIGALTKVGAGADALSFGVGGVALALGVAGLERAPGWLQTALASAALKRIGAASFSLYLWQQPFYVLHQRGCGAWTLPAALACGFLSFAALERPARRWLNARRAPSPDVPLAAATGTV